MLALTSSVPSKEPDDKLSKLVSVSPVSLYLAYISISPLPTGALYWKPTPSVYSGAFLGVKKLASSTVPKPSNWLMSVKNSS